MENLNPAVRESFLLSKLTQLPKLQHQKWLSSCILTVLTSCKPVFKEDVGVVWF